MGSSQSTRKITVNNENAHIIKVSDSVIERLKNVEQPSAPPASQISVSRPQTNVTPSINSNVNYGGSLTSLQIFQEKEKQLKENDQYWANRVSQLEGAQSKTKTLMEQEFSNTVSALQARLPKVPTKLSEAPCGDKKAKVLECYQSHPKQILLCAKEVADFANCVDMKRLAAA